SKYFADSIRSSSLCMPAALSTIGVEARCASSVRAAGALGRRTTVFAFVTAFARGFLSAARGAAEAALEATAFDVRSAFRGRASVGVDERDRRVPRAVRVRARAMQRV